MTNIFNNIVGQETAILQLSSAVKNPQEMTHSWLITGPAGSGRSNLARAFAGALECDNAGCGECQDCISALSGNHPDITYVSTDTLSLSIDEVRSIVTKASTTPVGGKWRIIIIEDADRMAERTANVLLKAIEEPPARTVWILCAPSAQDVIVTIRSRCRIVVLQTPSSEEVAQLLSERDGVDYDRALEAARIAHNHIGLAKFYATDPDVLARRAQLLTDVGRLSSATDAVFLAETMLNETRQLASDQFDERIAKEKAQLLRSLGVDEGASVPPKLRSQVTDFEKNAKKQLTRFQRDEIDRCITDIMSLFRDCMVAKTQANVPLINTSLTTLIESISLSRSTQQLEESFAAGLVARRRLMANVSPQLLIESLLVTFVQNS